VGPRTCVRRGVPESAASPAETTALGDRDEPRHVHVEREDKVAKFWLVPVRLQESGGFSRAELNRIQQLVPLNQDRFLEAWNEYCGE
jgi:hypothetical protein